MPAKIHGNLGSVAPAVATPTALYAVPASRKATGTLTICNQNASEVAVRVAVVNGAISGVAAKDYREYDTKVAANGVLEKSGVPVAAGYTLMVRSDTANVAFNFDGIEEDA
ncbi:hypothetical protein [Roseateles asaccharophilus]|uniref:Uncharacterized protein n=1 Tax=Roseateles asaccharophilus TaxID=582607 RepID=A0ABU2A3N2_9BURK|nr:hypothetical protein [Roseateles asaccharophilus]MDR7331771.1 hypothetical protein [Roseateles asaccharophilus]